MLRCRAGLHGDKAKKKFAEKKERDAKRTAAFAEGTSLGNKHLDRLVAANDWVRDKMDDFRDFRSGVKEKIADKYHGSKFESGVNKTKGWFKGVGSGIAGMAKSAGNWVKDKATDAGTAIKGSKLGQWVSRKKEERAKKKAEEALKPKEPGKFSKFMTGAKNWVSDKAKSAGTAIKESKLGQWVSRKKEERAKKKAAEAQKEPGWFKKTAAAAGEKIKSGAGWVKDKAVKGGTWVKNKAVKAGKWLSKKKDDISDWIEEKKQAYADHDDQRYLKRLVRKGGASAPERHRAGRPGSEARGIQRKCKAPRGGSQGLRRGKAAVHDRRGVKGGEGGKKRRSRCRRGKCSTQSGTTWTWLVR